MVPKCRPLLRIKDKKAEITSQIGRPVLRNFIFEFIIESINSETSSKIMQILNGD